MSPPATGDEEIGRRVQQRRKELNLNQGGLARRANRSQSWISGIERGEYGTGIDGLRDLARALDVTVAWLLGEPPIPRYGELWSRLTPTQRERFNKTFGQMIETWGQPEEEEGPA